MGTILKSSWEGIGSLALYSFCEAKTFPHPRMLDSFIYGMTTSLVGRMIEHQGKKHYEKGGEALCHYGGFLKNFVSLSPAAIFKRGVGSKGF